MKILDEYLKLQKEIYDYFGYKEDWKAFTIDDCRSVYWRIIGNDSVIFSEDEKDIKENIDNMEYYECSIYKSRFVDKSIYIGKEFTMIIVETLIDDNKHLSIYDNAKEIKE